MRLFFALALSAIFLQVTVLYGQSTEVYTHGLKDYDRAVQLYQEKQYQAAQILFKKVKEANPSYEVESDCAYFIANCAIRLNQAHGDVL
ncbi:MAG: hypothetical protein ACK4UK_06230, partial [Flavobacterium sp.]